MTTAENVERLFKALTNLKKNEFIYFNNDIVILKITKLKIFYSVEIDRTNGVRQHVMPLYYALHGGRRFKINNLIKILIDYDIIDYDYIIYKNVDNIDFINNKLQLFKSYNITIRNEIIKKIKPLNEEQIKNLKFKIYNIFDRVLFKTDGEALFQYYA